MYNHSDTVYDGCYDRKKIKTWKGAPELKCVEGEGQDGFLVEMPTAQLLSGI